MDKSNPQVNQIPFHHRLMHLLLCLLAVLLMAMVLVYGLIMTTNILTQLNHSGIGVYVMAFITCYLVIALGVGILYKLMIKHLKLVKSGVKPTG